MVRCFLTPAFIFIPVKTKIMLKKISFLLLLLLTVFFHSSPAQNWFWGRGSGNSGSVEGIATATDDSGNVYCTGFIEGPANFGPFSLNATAPGDAFLLKYNSTGNILWAIQCGSTGSIGWSVATDHSGNILLAGAFSAPFMAFGTDTIYNHGTGFDIFLIKFNSAGNELWMRSAGGPGTDGITGVATDDNDNILVTGNGGADTMIFDSDTISDPLLIGLFIAKYNPSGNLSWIRYNPGSGIDFSNGISCDRNGNSYITGKLNSDTLVMGSDTLFNTMNYTGFFVAKFDPSGNGLWARSAGGDCYTEGKNVVTDSTGNVYVTGNFTSPTITFGATVLTNADNDSVSSDFFLVKYDPYGNVLWAKAGNCAGNNVVYSLARDGYNRIFVAGMFLFNPVSFNTMTLPVPPDAFYPVFIFVTDPAGYSLCGTTLPDGGDDQIGISADNTGSAYLTSDFQISPFVIGPDTLPLNSSGEAFYVGKYFCPFTESVNEQPSAGNTFTIFPNPSTGTFHLKNYNGTGVLSFTVEDVLGNKVSSGNFTGNSFSLTGLPPGIYFCTVSDKEKNIFSGKILLSGN
jgi:hypothetical protein